MCDVQGMVDPGEVVTTTVKREFIEEAMDSLALSEDDQHRLNQQISDFFKKNSEVSQWECKTAWQQVNKTVVFLNLGIYFSTLGDLKIIDQI